jgi:hypothetical protein
LATCSNRRVHLPRSISVITSHETLSRRATDRSNNISRRRKPERQNIRFGGTIKKRSRMLNIKMRQGSFDAGSRGNQVEPFTRR